MLIQSKPADGIMWEEAPPPDPVSLVHTYGGTPSGTVFDGSLANIFDENNGTSGLPGPNGPITWTFGEAHIATQFLVRYSDSTDRAFEVRGSNDNFSSSDVLYSDTPPRNSSDLIALTSTGSYLAYRATCTDSVYIAELDYWGT